MMTAVRITYIKEELSIANILLELHKQGIRDEQIQKRKKFNNLFMKN